MDGVNQNQELDSNQAISSEPVEKLLKQSEVNEIVGHARQTAYEKARREIESQYQAKQYENTSKVNTIGGMTQMSEDEVRKIISEESLKQSQMTAAQNVAYRFHQKMQDGSKKYPDFEETIADLRDDLSTMPYIAEWAESLDNTADVMYELAKNPSKLASLQVLAHTSPKIAMKQMKELSGSIKKNEEAKITPAAPEPLSHIRPSNVGTDNGKMTVRDYKKQPWLRA